MIKVLVIDDEPLQRQGIVQLTPWQDFGAEVLTWNICARGRGRPPAAGRLTAGEPWRRRSPGRRVRRRRR